MAEHQMTAPVEVEQLDRPVHVLLIDNFDSFTFNLVDDLRRRGAEVEVWRNSVSASWALERAMALPAPRLIVLSPGPGRPNQAGCCEALIEAVCALDEAPALFGVCLGLQAMVEALGGTVGPAGDVVHGKTAWIDHDGRGIFANLPAPLQVGRYHSLVATAIPDSLEVSSRYGDLVMAVRHKQRPLAAVQFHPESVLTPMGGAMFDRILRWADSRSGEQA